MKRTSRTAIPRWQLPGGVMAHECAAESCTEIGTVVVRGPKGCEWALCPAHWRHLQRWTLGLMETVRTLDRPTCSRSDCHDEAAAVIEDHGEPPLPVCQRHWADLTWVAPTDTGTRSTAGAGEEPE
jgi:hypothetical protein